MALPVLVVFRSPGAMESSKSCPPRLPNVTYEHRHLYPYGINLGGQTHPTKHLLAVISLVGDVNFENQCLQRKHKPHDVVDPRQPGIVRGPNQQTNDNPQSYGHQCHRVRVDSVSVTRQAH